MAQSIEPNIADLANGWLRKYKLPYKLEQESVNAEIDKALSDYYTKNGGAGANRPDAKILLQDKNLDFYPILIEYKGYKDKLVKLDNDGQVENRTSKETADKYLNQEGKGIGLRNIRERLAHLYPNEYKLQILPEKEIFKIRLEIKSN